MDISRDGITVDISRDGITVDISRDWITVDISRVLGTLGSPRKGSGNLGNTVTEVIHPLKTAQANTPTAPLAYIALSLLS